MTVQESTFHLLNQLRAIYSEGEATAITDLVMEHLTGSKKAERMIYKNASITAEEETRLKVITERLMRHEPVQYVLNEAWFCGLRFFVNEHVLIPRPETEELVEWIISNCKFPVESLRILDIGTGSGCIPLALKRRIRKAEVWSCDISENALDVAKKNAESLGMEVRFIHLDFLNRDDWRQLPAFDIIVSNPPYVPERDKLSMHPNVLNHEPPGALFVLDNDALIFYRALAEFGKTHLTNNGLIYAEIHESMGESTSKLFRDEGYATELKKDMQGKERMIRAVLGRAF